MIFLWHIMNVRYFLAQEQGEGIRLVMKAFWLIWWYAIANYQTELFPTTLTARQNPKSNKKKQDEMDEIDHF